MYKITITENGIGYKVTLWKLFLFFYLVDTVCQCVNDHPYNDTVIKWKNQFNIPDESIIFKLTKK